MAFAALGPGLFNVMIADDRKYLREAWLFSTFPGIAILLTVLAFNLLGDGLCDVIDPRAPAVLGSGCDLRVTPRQKLPPSASRSLCSLRHLP